MPVPAPREEPVFRPNIGSYDGSALFCAAGGYFDQLQLDNYAMSARAALETLSRIAITSTRLPGT